MKTRINLALMLALALTLASASLTTAQQAGKGSKVPPARPKGPCDIYAAAGDPCVAAHSTTRAMYAAYNGPLYQVLRQSDGKTLDIGVVQPCASPLPMRADTPMRPRRTRSAPIRTAGSRRSMTSPASTTT